MAFFDWKEEYSVGVKRFDDQHKQLIAMLNELYDAMKGGKAGDVVKPILIKLVQYTKTHFAAEEQVMKMNGYPDYEAHKKEHDELAKQAASLLEQEQQGKAALSIQISNFLKQWLMDHIMGKDKKYGPFLNGKGVH